MRTGVAMGLTNMANMPNCWHWRFCKRYAQVRELGDEHLGRNPRSLVTEDDIRAALGAR